MAIPRLNLNTALNQKVLAVLKIDLLKEPLATIAVTKRRIVDRRGDTPYDRPVIENSL